MFQGILIGNLGADAEYHNENGHEFCTFRIANTDRWTDKEGQKVETTMWVDCIIQGKPNVMAYLKKGQMVCCFGNETLRVYSSKKDRCMKAGVTISVRHIELLGGKADAVPSILYTPDGSREYKTAKYYNVPELVNHECPGGMMEVVSKAGERYLVDKNGWVIQQQEEAE